MAPSTRLNLPRSAKKSEVAMGENRSQRVKKLQAMKKIQSVFNTPSPPHTPTKRTRRRLGATYDSSVGVLDEIQPTKLGVDENMLLDNLEVDLSSDEDIQDVIAVKNELKFEGHDTSIGEYIVQEENLAKSMEADKSTQMRNNSCNSVRGSNDAKRKVDRSSGSQSVDPTFKADEETHASEGGSGETEEDVTCVLENILKTYCKTNTKCQNMLFTLSYTQNPNDVALLQDIITSGKELASSIRLMANTVQILAVAERMKSKAAIIRTRIELAKAKREGIEIK